MSSVHPLVARDLFRSPISERSIDKALAARRARRNGKPVPAPAAPAVATEDSMPVATLGWRRDAGFVSTPVEPEVRPAPAVVSRPRKSAPKAKLPALLPEGHDIAAEVAAVAGEQPTVSAEPVAAAPVVEAPAAPAVEVEAPVVQPVVPAWQASLAGLGMLNIPMPSTPVEPKAEAKAPAKPAVERPAAPRMLTCCGCPKKHPFPASEARVPSLDVLRKEFDGVPPTREQLEARAGCKYTRSEGWFPLQQTLDEIAARIARSEERKRQAQAEYDAGALDRLVESGGRIGRIAEKLRDGNTGHKPVASSGPSKAEQKFSPPVARGGKTLVLGQCSTDDVMAALRAKAQ